MLLSRIVFAHCTLAVSFAAPIDELRKSFANPPDDARIMMRWWWFGPAVTKPRLEREMQLMKQGGIGGFEVQPVYPVALDEPELGFRNLPYLSSEFLDMLKFTGEKARELGLRLDLTIGSGWPYGGPSVPITEAAGRLRWERAPVAEGSRRVPLPSIGNGERFIAAFAAGTQRELKDIRDGVLWLPREEQAKEIWYFVASRTGQQVKRPSVNAEGFVIDHLDRSAIRNYLRQVGDPMMKALASTSPHAIFCDSLEVYGNDWTSDMLEEFRNRRGYELKPYLPALVADIGPETKGVRYDWGRTLTQLLEERFLQPMREWSKNYRTLFRIQDYGVPAATISSNAYADIPEGEGAQWKVVRAARWASSASHLYGRPIASSETWTWLHSPSFRATPLDMKAEADIHFLQGINQLIGHGWPYNPDTVEYPGWRFYAAAVFNDKNPWWIVMPDVAKYLQRVSHLMRQGRPANDVALYLPDADVMSHFSAGRVHTIEALREHLGRQVMPQILEAGYGLDFFNDGALEQVGRVDGNALVLGGNRYRIVVLPGVEFIPAETLRKLEQFVKGGGILVATRRVPATAPGLKPSDADKAEVAAISQRLFSEAARLVADEAQLGAALRKLMPPDFAIEPAVPEIGFVHRGTEDAEIYFIANTGNQRRKVKAVFRAAGAPSVWDPMTGQIHASSRDAVLDLEPYASRVVVFSKQSAQPEPDAAAGEATDISGGWRVSFGDAKPAELSQLRYWTDDESTRYFSGVATYEKEIEIASGARVRLDFGESKPVPASALTNGMRAWLDPPVREAAVVYVNGQRAGALWCPPYTLDITRLVKPGRNIIRVAVANTAINHMAGHKLPDYRLLNLKYGVRFEPQDMNKVQPVPSGLTGPIRLWVTQ